jgi:predicted porin
MNKKILTAAVGAALVASAGLAQADVKIYGKISADVVSVTNSDRYKTTQVDDVGNSRIGFDAVEDLGGGLKGLARMEFATNPVEYTNPNTGSSTNYSWSDRLHWVGLQGMWGTFQLGTFDSPYKQAGGVNWDPFVATSFEARNNGGMSGSAFGHTSYMDNAVMYTTPKFAGVTGQLLINPDDSNSTAGNGTTETSTTTTATATVGQGNKDYSASVQWSGGPLTVVAAKSKDANGKAGASNKPATLTKLGVQGKFGNHTISVQHEWDENDTNSPSLGGLTSNSNTGAGSAASLVTATNPNVTTNNRNGKLLFVGYQLKLGNEIIVAQLGKQDYAEHVNTLPNGTGSTVASADSKYRAIGVIHNFSKNTRAYLGYRTTQNKDGAGSIAATNVPNDAKIRVVGAGLGVNF